MPTRPNIVLIMADDMGFCDIGCYGSEIRTPNLDRLARNGIRFMQMYNAAKCCPSRAALLTAINPHQAGIGHMTNDFGVPGYRGFLSDNCVTVAEVLRASGYRTMLSGKWRVGSDYEDPDTSSWPIGEPGHPVPRQRGFDRFFGLLGGAGSYFNPPGLMKDDRFVKVESSDFYFTDAIAENAVQMIDESVALEKPFFLYAAFTAPHWPLHAPEGEIERYRGLYMDGWDALRTSRHEELKGMGLLDSMWKISPRHSQAEAWDAAPHKEWEDLRMAVYAAQIDRMDTAIGKIVGRLDALGITDNTLIMFLSDNGGCAEYLKEDVSVKPKWKLYAQPTPDGRRMRIGNEPSILPGPADSFLSYDVSWANASNSPFRLFKSWVHEGGVSTPFIVHWPEKVKGGGIAREPAYIMDIPATCIEAAGATYPSEFGGKSITPMEGESFMRLIEGGVWSRQQPIFWEHMGNSAVRAGDWKLVREHGRAWELYEMNEDRTELNDLARQSPDRVAAMSRAYDEWARRCGVLPWPIPGGKFGGNPKFRPRG